MKKGDIRLCPLKAYFMRQGNAQSTYFCFATKQDSLHPSFYSLRQIHKANCYLSSIDSHSVRPASVHPALDGATLPLTPLFCSTNETLVHLLYFCFTPQGKSSLIFRSFALFNKTSLCPSSIFLLYSTRQVFAHPLYFFFTPPDKSSPTLYIFSSLHQTSLRPPSIFFLCSTRQVFAHPLHFCFTPLNKSSPILYIFALLYNASLRPSSIFLLYSTRQVFDNLPFFFFTP